MMGVQGRASSRPTAQSQIGRRHIQQQQQRQRQRPADHHNHQGASDSFDVSLQSSSSGVGDEQQTYESDEIRQVYLQQHDPDCLHKQPFQSEGGEITPIPCSGDRRPSEDRASYLNEGIQSAEAMRTNRASTSQQHQKHRQLQAHVHQQLQRIYGDRSQTTEPKRHHHHQDQLLRMNRQKQMIQRQRTEQNSNSQEDQFGSHEPPANPNNVRSAVNLAQQSSSFEPAYNSLSSPNLTPTTNQQCQHQHQHHLYKDCRRLGAPISAIPEEEDTTASDGLLSTDQDDSSRLLLLNRENQGERKPTAIVRKSQLESLHYATVTAAALLSATANAAAAIAATTEQQQFKQHQLIGCRSKTSPSRIDSVEDQESNKYSHPAYQEVRPSKRPPDCCHLEQERNERIRRMRCIHHNQQQQQQVLMMKQNQRLLYAEVPATDAYQSMPPVGQLAPKGYNLHHNHLQHPFRHQKPPHQPNNHHYHHHNDQQPRPTHLHQANYHQALLNRPIPPRPPARRPMMMVIDPSGASMRDDKTRFIPPHMQQQPQPPPTTIMPTALAVVHTGKEAPTKVDLIRRMLINNMVAAQRVATSESQYNPKARQQPRAGMEAYQMLAPLRENLYSSANQQQVFALGLPVGRAASDSSGHSSVPLVVNRDLVPMSFIERLCRIDLTLFWWSLLLISLLFVGIIVTISRYTI